jgi:hypothetical protein
MLRNIKQRLLSSASRPLVLLLRSHIERPPHFDPTKGTAPATAAEAEATRATAVAQVVFEEKPVEVARHMPRHNVAMPSGGGPISGVLIMILERSTEFEPRLNLPCRQAAQPVLSFATTACGHSPAPGRCPMPHA